MGACAASAAALAAARLARLSATASLYTASMIWRKTCCSSRFHASCCSLWRCMTASAVGKTACAVALARELYGETWHSNFIELNASDERGIDVVRNNIKNFARTAPLGEARFKIIFLDEADALTSDAQSALRRTMERYAATCRFVISCNYSSKIIEPIQSRCAVYRFGPLNPKDIEAMARRIEKGEGIKITKDGLDAIVYVARGDMRKAVNALQSAATVSKEITAEAIYETTSTAKPKEIAKQ